MPARIEPSVWVLAALLPSLALAQTPSWPTAQDMAQALKAHPFPSQEQISSQPVPRPPRVDARRSAIDIEALARDQGQIPGAAASSLPASTPLRIFITLDMPRASLQLLTDQAARTDAVLVLRGLKAQSMRQTLAVVRELIGDRKVAWVIDPQAFTRFAVRQAPTFVLTLNDAGNQAQSSCRSGCATPAGFVSVAGDVSLDYALEAMLRRKTEAAAHATPILKKLRGS